MKIFITLVVLGLVVFFVTIGVTGPISSSETKTMTPTNTVPAEINSTSTNSVDVVPQDRPIIDYQNL